MKSIVSGYLFNKATKQITFPSSYNITLERLLFVIDQTAGQIIYDPGVSGKGGVITGNVLTLSFDTNTGSFANNDTLIIGFEDGDTGATEGTLQYLAMMFSALLERNEGFSNNGSQYVNVMNTPSVGISGTPSVTISGTATVSPVTPAQHTYTFYLPIMSDIQRQNLSAIALNQLLVTS